MPISLKESFKNPIGFGGAAISGEGKGYGFGKIDEGAALDLLKLAFEKGIRLFDNAPIYGFSLSEKRMGKAFKDYREKVFLTSKSGVSWHDNGRVNMTNDPEETKKMLENSLRDFQSDYIDLYFVHWPDEKVDIRRPIEVLAKAKLEGKIRHLGLCNTNLEDLDKASEIASIEIVQGQLNFFQRENLELLDELEKRSIPFQSWGTLDKGILTGRVTKERKFDQEDCRSDAPWWKALDFEERFRIMDQLNPMLEKHQVDPVSFALGFNLNRPAVQMCLCGPRNEAQLDGVLKALETLPSNDVLEQAEAIWDAR